MEKESLQQLLRQGLSLEQIGKRFGKNPSTVSYWILKHGLQAVHRDKHAARGGIERERLEALIEQSMTIAQIGRELGLSKTTVRHWLNRYGLRTLNAGGRRPAELAQAAKEAGLLTVRMLCAHHGQTEFLVEGRGYYRCKRCRVESVARRRRKVKGILVKEAGGRCAVCGYDRCLGALEFHHLEPEQKRLEVNAKGVALAIDTLREEAKKCVLLCSNCHSEVENGVTTLPATVHSPKTGAIHHNPG